MSKEALERICFNCNCFFPDSEDFTDHGICLEDDVFEPFLDEIFEMDYSSCQDLVDEKKFLGGRDACEKFEEVEIVEMDDESPLGEMIVKLKETGEVDQELLRDAMLEEKLKKIDLKTLPVSPYMDNLNSANTAKVNSALRSLGALIVSGNSEAYEVLYDLLKKLPLPQNIEEVHHKIKILDGLKYGEGEQRSKLIPLLIGELYQIPSNNTTRQWITKILKVLSDGPEEEVCQPLETLLEERIFPVKTRNKIEAVLDHLLQEDREAGEWFLDL